MNLMTLVREGHVLQGTLFAHFQFQVQHVKLQFSVMVLLKVSLLPMHQVRSVAAVPVWQTAWFC